MDEKIEETISKLEDAVTNIEKALEVLLKVPQHQLRENMMAKERAKMEVTLAYVMNSMFWMYLCSQGISPAEHPVKKELARIQSYFTRVQNLENKQLQKANDDKNISPNQIEKTEVKGESEGKTINTEKRKRDKLKNSRKKKKKKKNS